MGSFRTFAANCAVDCYVDKAAIRDQLSADRLAVAWKRDGIC